MDLRSLDPYVNDPPGRANNLYKEPTLPTSPAYDDRFEQDIADPSPLCKEAISTGPGQMNACFIPHQARKDVIPPRLVQFDIGVENAWSDNEGVTTIAGKDIPLFWVAIGIFAILFFLKLTRR